MMRALVFLALFLAAISAEDLVGDAPIESAGKEKISPQLVTAETAIVVSGRRYGWVNTSFIDAIYDPIGTINGKPSFQSREPSGEPGPYLGKPIYLYWSSSFNDWVISPNTNDKHVNAICVPSTTSGLTPDTCDGVWQVYNRDVQPNAFQEDAEVKAYPTCNLAIGGRMGFNSIINDVYLMVKVINQHPYYKGVNHKLYIYHYDPTDDWVIGRVSGSKRALAVLQQNVDAPNLKSPETHWRINDGYEFKRDFSVTTDCYTGIHKH